MGSKKLWSCLAVTLVAGTWAGSANTQTIFDCGLAGVACTGDVTQTANPNVNVGNTALGTLVIDNGAITTPGRRLLDSILPRQAS